MFVPNTVIFEKGSLDYALGSQIYDRFKKESNVKIIEASSNRVGPLIPGENMYEKYRAGKKILVVGVKKSLRFESCKPSAHYQLPLVSGCMGQCEYCYLNTQLGDKPFVRVHVNIDEILSQAEKYMQERKPDITLFEGAATSDPIPVEPYTHTLKNVIEYFGNTELGRFRFVTKYNDIDSLLEAKHNGHTTVRFSLNTEKVIKDYEHFTSSVKTRIEAAARLADKDYNIGFIIAPVLLYAGWRDDYRRLLENLKEMMPQNKAITIHFEIISHRFTAKAKNTILQIFPETTLPMNEEERKFKYGQFGYGKYVYTKEDLSEMKSFFEVELDRLFENKIIQYII
ncbi:MAG: putative spore photoproduct lyase [Clostridia bacterium]|jgi:spore photoproduct lyase|nr:putative spore photoproduct lyase [Clostridia bacterium]